MITLVMTDEEAREMFLLLYNFLSNNDTQHRDDLVLDPTPRGPAREKMMTLLGGLLDKISTLRGID